MAQSWQSLVRLIASSLLPLTLTAVSASDVQMGDSPSSDETWGLCEERTSLMQLKLSGTARSFTSLHALLHIPGDVPSGGMANSSSSSVDAIAHHMERSMKEKTNSSLSKIQKHLTEPRRHQTISLNSTVPTPNVASPAKTNPEHGTNTTGSRPKNITGETEETTAFAHAKYQAFSTQDLVVKVDIAQPNDIITVYTLMFVPLLMGWFYYWQQPSKRCYSVLLQLSVAALSVGSVLVNQSLTVLMKAPMAITTVQAASMCVGGTVVACMQLSAGRLKSLDQQSETLSVSAPHIGLGTILCWWLPASIGFAIYSVMDHYVSYYCSISERTVLGNLAPALSLVIETNLGLLLLGWPAAHSVVSLSSKMAMLAMIFGAVIFALQYPDFNALGLDTALTQNVCHIIYRLLQRFVLGSMTGVSIAGLCAFDGFVLFVPSFILSIYESQDFWGSWQVWLSNPSVVVMLVLSLACFGMGHFVIIHMLKDSTATALVVLSNVANALCVIMGIYFFGDNNFERPLAFVGIVISILAACWFEDNHHDVKGAKHNSPRAVASNCSVDSMTADKLDATAAS
eukprot:TRINITY_DN24621_c0_g1_i1.p1 TRINITY_DN24621_c0_g1~~TRINITY_DN24621_c0_g1_i1.p1  ORF type:complete len:596 (+),score=91.01 TRINITY_DN24621_c0_g1_i1:83-1789(+)